MNAIAQNTIYVKKKKDILSRNVLTPMSSKLLNSEVILGIAVADS